MEKEIIVYFEDPHVYDGTCAVVYSDFSYEILEQFRDTMTENKRDEIESALRKIVSQLKQK